MKYQLDGRIELKSSAAVFICFKKFQKMAVLIKKNIWDFFSMQPHTKFCIYCEYFVALTYM